MNKKFIFLGIFIAACCYSAQAQEAKTGTQVTASAQEITEGKQLLLRSVCTACHMPQNKLVGPAYIEIVKKYPLTNANVNLLAQKIIKGGAGVWGKIPMSPHPALAEADAKKIVKYILSEF